MALARPILRLNGSLRKNSLNGQLLQTLPSVAPMGMDFTPTFELHDIPAYDEDTDQAGAPAPVLKLRAALAAADGVVIAAPEYNHGISGVLKNAIDWASRPYGAAAYSGKCVVILVATTGRALGFCGLADMRRLTLDLCNFVIPGPQAVVHDAGHKFTHDSHGTPMLNDPGARAVIAGQLDAMQMAVAKGVGPLCLHGFVAAAKHPSRQTTWMPQISTSHEAQSSQPHVLAP